MKRRIKKQHWGWVIGGGVIVLLIATPLDVFVRLAYETQEKAEITEDLLVTLTGTVKAGAVLMTALVALIFYKAVKK